MCAQGVGALTREKESGAMAVDWLKIKTEYINGDISYRKLAEKHSIPFPTLRDRATNEGWKGQRDKQRNKVIARTEQKTIEKISEALSEEAAAKVAVRGMLWKMTQNWVMEQDEKIKDVADFRRMVQSCVDLGIMDVQEPEENDGDSLIEALTKSAAGLFDDEDDSGILPEEEEE